MTDYGHYCDARCLYAGSPNPQGDRLRRRPSTRRGTPGAGGTRTEEARGFRGAAVESATSRRDPDRPTDRPTVRPSLPASLPPSRSKATTRPAALPGPATGPRFRGPASGRGKEGKRRLARRRRGYLLAHDRSSSRRTLAGTSLPLQATSPKAAAAAAPPPGQAACALTIPSAMTAPARYNAPSLPALGPALRGAHWADRSPPTAPAPRLAASPALFPCPRPLGGSAPVDPVLIGAQGGRVPSGRGGIRPGGRKWAPENGLGGSAEGSRALHGWETSSTERLLRS